MKFPRVKIVTHRVARDGSETLSEEESGNLPFSERQALTEALSHLKRAVSIVPSNVATLVQVETARRAVAHVAAELAVASKLLEEK